MEASNQFCGIANCSNPAEKFAITPTAKIKACSSHVDNLLDKRLIIYDMEAFNFIQSEADLPLYEARRTEVEVGIGNLTVLETACDEELRTVLQTLEKAKLKAIHVIEAAYELHRIKTQLKYQETKDHLQVIRNNLVRYRLLKEAQLNPEAQVLFQDLTYVPRFLRIVVVDPTLELARIAVKSFKSSEQTTEDAVFLLNAAAREKFITELVTKATVHWNLGLYEVSEEEKHYAESLGYPEELEQRMEVIETTRRKKLVKLLELTVSEDEIRQVASDYQDKALNQFALGEKTVKEIESDNEKKAALEYAAQQYEKSIKSWEKALHLLKLRLPRDQMTARLSFEYGKFLWEQWEIHSEAVNMLKQSLEIEQALNPYSEETGKVTLLLGRVLGFEHKGDQAAEVITHTLSILPEHASIRNVLYCCLAYTYSYTKSTEETEQMLLHCVVDKEHIDSEYTPLSLKLLGVAYFNLKRYTEAETSLNDALAIYMMHFPTSPDTANTLNNIGNLLKFMTHYEEAYAMHQEALTKLRTNFPMSRQVAATLADIGELYREMEKYAESETVYKEVLEIYETLCPHSEKIAKTYYALGRIAKDSLMYGQAVQYLKQALQLYQRDFPDTVDAVDTVYDLGVVYIHRKEEVWIALFQEGLELMKTQYPTSERTARMYRYFGALLAVSEKVEEAVNMWKCSLAILQTNFPNSLQTAQMLSEIGESYELFKRIEDAEKTYQSALAIYEGYFPNSEEFKGMLVKLEKLYTVSKQEEKLVELRRRFR